MQAAIPACVRVTVHFLHRLHERVPGACLSEGWLQRELLEAEFCPDDSNRHTYVTLRIVAGKTLALVVAVEDGLFTLITLFEPGEAWKRRYAGRRTLPGSLLAVAS